MEISEMKVVLDLMTHKYNQGHLKTTFVFKFTTSYLKSKAKLCPEVILANIPWVKSAKTSG